MGRPAMSAEAIKNNKISIISAAMDMIRESGIQSVSARSLGARIGMNSALIYRYFKDIDEVVLFACVHVLQEYTREMTEARSFQTSISTCFHGHSSANMLLAILRSTTYCSSASTAPGSARPSVNITNCFRMKAGMRTISCLRVCTVHLISATETLCSSFLCLKALRQVRRSS